MIAAELPRAIVATMPRPAAASPLAGAPRRARRLVSAAAVTAAAFALLAAPARAVSVTPTGTASQTATSSETRTSLPSFLPAYVISTVAGSGVAGFSGDGGAATSAALNTPYDVAVDTSGNLFIADISNHRVRRVAAGTGAITTVAGIGGAGFSGDGGAATSSSLNFPVSLAIDPAGALLIADRSNRRVRKVDPPTGIITTVAGNGQAGFNGDGRPATTASLADPHGITFDIAGNLFIVDTLNHRVRRVAAGTGVITTVAGDGVGGFSGDGGAATSASLNIPIGIAFDVFGNLFISEASNHRVRQVAVGTSVITTVAGTGIAGFSGDGSAATSASLWNPMEITIDLLGNLLIIDRLNNRVRLVAVAASGVITTLIGDGQVGNSVSLNYPFGLAVGPSGRVFVGDSRNHRVRRVPAPTPPSSSSSFTPSSSST